MKPGASIRFSVFVSAVMVLTLGIGPVLPADSGKGARSRPSGVSSAGHRSSEGRSTPRNRAGRPGQRGSSGGRVPVSGRSTWRRGGSISYYGYPYVLDPWFGVFDTYGWGGWYYGYPWIGGPIVYPYNPPPYDVVQVRGGAADPGAPALMEINVRPRKARLELDGEDLGKARAFDGRRNLLPVSPGKRTLFFRADGYQTFRVELEVRERTLYRLEHEMARGEGEDPDSILLPPEPKPEPAPKRSSSIARGLLKVYVQPPDAAVYLDREYLGRAGELAELHGALPVAVGSHILEAVRPGYRQASRRIDVRKGEPSRVQLSLEPVKGP